jgi:hypothetical protein
MSRQANTSQLQPIKYKQPPEINPIEEARHYVDHEWFQPLIPCRSKCYRCGERSPVLHVPIGTIAFGNDSMLKRGTWRDRDITKEVQMAYAEVGWKFQRYRAYCATCKNMGSV